MGGCKINNQINQLWIVAKFTSRNTDVRLTNVSLSARWISLDWESSSPLSSLVFKLREVLKVNESSLKIRLMRKLLREENVFKACDYYDSDSRVIYHWNIQFYERSRWKHNPSSAYGCTNIVIVRLYIDYYRYVVYSRVKFVGHCLFGYCLLWFFIYMSSSSSTSSWYKYYIQYTIKIL